MKKRTNPETGITETVKTFFSSYTIFDIIKRICEIKTDAVMGWLKKHELKPENTLIIGTYLTGAAIANRIAKKSKVTVIDIHPHLKCLLDPRISFKPYSNGEWDFIIETTGLGGISPEKLKKFKTKTFLVEDPRSDGSDITIEDFNETYERIGAVEAPLKGILHTHGLGAKTSGTMTLTLEVIRKAINTSLQIDGVLYSSSHLNFYEGILFKEKDCKEFIQSLKKSSLIVSSLQDIDCDTIIEDNLKKIKAYIEEW